MVWVPKNGARETHLPKVTGLVTDDRARQYWDGHEALMQPFHERYALKGPCAGLFMVFGRDARWDEGEPPEPVYVEDAHSKQYKRQHPQFDSKRFAGHVIEMLGS